MGSKQSIILIFYYLILKMSNQRNQYILVNTKFKTSGSPWQFTLNFDAGLIHARADESIKVSLVKLTLPMTIHQVNSTNNQITFINTNNVSTTITIDNGTYTVYEMAKQLQTKYPALTSSTFDKSQNHFIFTFNNNHRITFLGKSNELFGFSGNITTPSLTIESDLTAKPNPIDQIVIHMSGITPVWANLDNLNTEECTLSNILSVIDLDQIPYGTLYYINDNSEFQISIQDNQIKTLNILLTDINGNTLDYCNLQNFSMIIKIEFVKNNDDTVNLLNDIREYSRYSFLSHSLNNT